MIPTVLYIDDEDLNILVFEKSFKRKFIVRAAKSGEEGLEILKTHPDIDVVISDLKMPGMNGLEFVSAAKSISPEIPCFLLSGYNLTSEIQEALKKELILKYFMKPLNNSEIEGAVLECINSK